jgi:hypothetical protein
MAKIDWWGEPEFDYWGGSDEYEEDDVDDDEDYE